MTREQAAYEQKKALRAFRVEVEDRIRKKREALQKMMFERDTDDISDEAHNELAASMWKEVGAGEALESLGEWLREQGGEL